MKKKIIIYGIITLTIILAGTAFIINNSDAKVVKNHIPNTNSNTVNTKINKSNMEKLTKEAFLQKVFNYEQNRDWKYEGDLPCLIDFYADWCGPCKMVHPILEELSTEYKGKIRIYQIDTEAEQELAAAFGIRSIPSLLFCPTDGQPQMAQGALPKATLKKAIEEILLSEKAEEVK